MDAMLELVTDEISTKLGVEARELSASSPLNSQGLDSVMGSIVRARLERVLDITLSPILFWEARTVKLTASHLLQSWEADHLPAEQLSA